MDQRSAPAGTMIDLWYASTEPDHAPAAAWLNAVASPEERKRCKGFLRPEDARTYCLAHGLLRIALSHYGNLRPEAWRFVAAAGGRPELAEETPAPVAFNLSHTRGLVACAFGGGRVGVDVEAAARGRDVAELAADFFGPGERTWLASGPAHDADRRAAWLWTAKEALLKADGRGLSAGPRAVMVAWDRQGAARYAGVPEGPPGRWRLVPFRIGPGHVGTVALTVDSGEARLRAVRLRALAAGPETLEVTARRASDGWITLPGGSD